MGLIFKNVSSFRFFLFILFINVTFLNVANSAVSEFNNFTSSSFLNHSMPIHRQDLYRLKDLDETYSACNGIDIRELTILQVQKLFDLGRLTSVQLTNCYLERIRRMDNVLKAVIEVNPNSLQEAQQADVERLNSGFSYQHRNLMHGIPILLKDNIAVKDHMETTAGSWALFGLRPKRDADVVKMLKGAGVVIIGKSNLSEFAAFRGALPNGWSGRGGQSLSPYNLLSDPQGSSTGSATGIAANLAMVSVGTETDGSLIGPASMTGIFALKPTLGLISTQGVIPISRHFDCVGPMARNIVDLAILFDAMTSKSNSAEHNLCGRSYIQCVLKRKFYKKFRVGIFRSPFWDLNESNSPVLTHQLPQLENILNLMRNSSEFEIIDPVELVSDLKNISWEKEALVKLHDFKYEMNKYLENDVVSSTLEGSAVKSLQDIIRFNEIHDDGKRQEIFEEAMATDGILNETYIEARETNQMSARQMLDKTMNKHTLDALLFPNLFPVDGFPKFEDFDELPSMGYRLAAIAGYPSMNVPAGIGEKGVPFGITFIGMPNTEVKLLQIGYLMEKINPARKPPQFIF